MKIKNPEDKMKCSQWSEENEVWFLVEKRSLSMRATITTQLHQPVWPNGWLFAYELSGSRFESSCSQPRIL